MEVNVGVLGSQLRRRQQCPPRPGELALAEIDGPQQEVGPDVSGVALHGPLRVLLGHGQLSHRQLQFDHAVQQSRGLRAGPQCFLHCAPRLGLVAVLPVRGCEEKVGLGRVGRFADLAAQLGDGLLAFSLGQQDAAPGDAGGHVLRPISQDLVVYCRCFRDASGRQVELDQPRPQLKVLRREGQATLVLGQGRIHLLSLKVEIADGHGHLGGARLTLPQRTEYGFASFLLLLGVEDVSPGQVEGGAAGIALHTLLKDALGLRQLPLEAIEISQVGVRL